MSSLENKKVSSLSEEDKKQLQIIVFNQKLARANVEKYVALDENAQLLYQNYVLKLYMKYQLSSEDKINEDGEITFEKSNE